MNINNKKQIHKIIDHKNKQEQCKDSKCEHMSELKSIKKCLVNKNREICTLNRIIKNLRNEIQQMSAEQANKNNLIDQLNNKIKVLKENSKINENQKIQERQKQGQKILQMVHQIQMMENQKHRCLNNSRFSQSHSIDLENLTKKCQILEFQNLKLHQQIENMQVRSISSKSHRPKTYQDTYSDNPFAGFLTKTENIQISNNKNMTRKLMKARKSQNDYTWCRISQLMEEQQSPFHQLDCNKKLSNSDLDTQKAIDLIRRENEKIKMSMR